MQVKNHKNVSIILISIILKISCGQRINSLTMIFYKKLQEMFHFLNSLRVLQLVSGAARPQGSIIKNGRI